jgi:hypothetical protein
VLLVSVACILKTPCYVGPSHHGMAGPRVADEGHSLQIWRVVENILNKQLRTVDKGWSSSLGVGRGARTRHCKNILLRNVTQGLGIGRRMRQEIRVGRCGLD